MSRLFPWCSLALVCLDLAAFPSPATALAQDPFPGADRVRVYLNPNTGRFWTRDSFEGNQEDPLSLHKYLYCGANPVNGKDPSGHETLISIQFTWDIITFVAGQDASLAQSALEGTRAMFGADEGLNSIIYGLQVFSTVSDAVARTRLAAGGAQIAMKLNRVLMTSGVKLSRTIMRAMKKAEKAGAATLEHEAVFYAGREGRNYSAAMEFAKNNNKKLLEDTDGGKILNDGIDWTKFTGREEEARAISAPLSKVFAEGASGEVHAFVGGSSPDSVWSTVELPALMNNSKVRKIVIHDADLPGVTKIIYK